MSEVNVEKLCLGCMNEHSGVCSCGFDENKYVPSVNHLPLRTILNGKYLIGRVLGEGGFGITYIGIDLNLEIKVAIKEYYPNGFVARDATHSTVNPYVGEPTEIFEKGRDRFINEAKSLAKFRALPGIVTVSDFFMENGTAYIAMEYVDGQTMKTYLLTHTFSADQVFDLMQPVMQSLAYVHQSGMIHRDISPDNIMITGDGQIKLLDFGAARDFADSGNKSLSVILKLGYAPSEQYSSKGQQGPWTDVYALCATMYKIITGITPDESIDRAENDELKPPSQLGIVMNPKQEAALLKGMEVKRTERFQSITELMEAIYPQRNAEVTVPYAQITPKVKPTAQPKKVKQPVVQRAPRPAVERPVRPVVPREKKPLNKKLITGIACGGGAVLLAAVIALTLPKAEPQTNVPVNNPVQLAESNDSPILQMEEVKQLLAFAEKGNYQEMRNLLENEKVVEALSYEEGVSELVYTNTEDGNGFGLYTGPYVYVGEYKNGKRSGHGSWFAGSDYTFEGEWKNDKPNGEGSADKTNSPPKEREEDVTYVVFSVNSGTLVDGFFNGEMKIAYTLEDDDYHEWHFPVEMGKYTGEDKIICIDSNCSTNINISNTQGIRGFVPITNKPESTPKPKPTPSEVRADVPVVHEYGNTNGNIKNGNGFYAQKGNWVYFANSYGLWRTQLNGTDLQKITEEDHYVYYINIYGDYIIYYFNETVYKIKNDGTEKQALLENKTIRKMLLVDDHLFLSIAGENMNEIYTMSVNGGELKKVCKTNRFNDTFFVIGNHVYYYPPNDYNIHKIKTDGTGVETIVGIYNDNIDTDGEYFYFEDWGIRKAAIDGSSNQYIIEDGLRSSSNGQNMHIRQIQVYEGYVYYTIYDDSTTDKYGNKYLGGALYRIGVNGGEAKKLNADVCSDLSIVGEYIYYFNRTKDCEERMKLDGSERKTVGWDNPFAN